MTLPQRKPIGGLQNVRIIPLNGAEPRTIPLVEERSGYTEELLSESGILRVHHTLTLIVPRTEVVGLLSLIPSMVVDGIVAQVSTRSGETLAVGGSDRFRNEQPLRLTSVMLASGIHSLDGNDTAFRFESDDTSALEEF